MKKLSFLVLLCLSIFTGTCTHAQKEPIDLTPEKEVEYWAYFVKNFFPKGAQGGNHPGKFYDDIRIQLINASGTDSLAAFQIIGSLDSLIPNNIGLESTKENANLIIEILPENYLETGLKIQGPNGNIHEGALHRKQSFTVQRKNDNRPEIKQNYFSTILSDAVTPEERGKILRYFIVFGITHRKHIVHSSGQWDMFTPDMYQEVTDRPQLYMYFTPKDRFCVAKLYAPDLGKQLKEYVLQHHGLWYYINLTVDGGIVVGVKIVLFILCFLLLIALSYATVLSKRFKYPYLGYLANALLLAVALALALYINRSLPLIKDFTINFSPVRFPLTPLETIMISLFFAVVASLLFFLEKYLIKNSYRLLHRIILKTCLTLVALALTLFPLLLSERIKTGNMPFFALLVSYGYGLAVALFRGIFLYFKERSDALLRQKDVELSKLKELKAKAEVASLHARINPHFLYNSLNSIAGLAHNDADKTEKMALSLSDLFRHNINRKNKTTSTLKDEMDTIKAYLEIEQIRFGERMQFSIEMDKESEALKIPRNLIQPLVENAIKHGVSQIQGKGTIAVSARRNAKGLTMAVHDNGPEFPEGLVSGYGLQSIHDILKLSYKDEALFNMENSPKKRIWINITEKGLQKDIENEQ
ncbi:sensor histidine kinase [Maribacter sp. 2304DJ31-5]|uniref:sensor histidine kinase n=1 Tax=Maribacter sp. 2304DJ31-5 TaxID=3386273 RepID=UPI0039BD0A6C